MEKVSCITLRSHWSIKRCRPNEGLMASGEPLPLSASPPPGTPREASSENPPEKFPFCQRSKIPEGPKHVRVGQLFASHGKAAEKLVLRRTPLLQGRLC